MSPSFHRLHGQKLFWLSLRREIFKKRGLNERFSITAEGREGQETQPIEAVVLTAVRNLKIGKRMIPSVLVKSGVNRLRKSPPFFFPLL